MAPEQMSSLRELQQQFLQFLQQQPNQMQSLVLDQGKLNAKTRLDIYANAYRLRLKQVVETDHPVLGTYLGDELFDLMFQNYLALHPSQFTSLRQFCDRLPKFLKEHSPFDEHPILAEIAAFERLLLVAFDAPDSLRLTTQALAQVAPELWPQIKIRFHPSTQLFRESWNTVTSWQAIKEEKTPTAATRHSQTHTWLLWRNHELLTQFRSLAVDELYMIEAYLSGQDFSNICEGLLTWHSADEVPVFALQTLQSWLNQGLVQQIITIDEL